MSVSSHLSPGRPHLGERDIRKMDPELLNLPLAVKIPVAPGSKPVFFRGKLGEKVEGVERGRKSFLFRRVPLCRDVLVATCCIEGAAALQLDRAGQGKLQATWNAEEKALVHLGTGFWHCACVWLGPCLQQAAVCVWVPGQCSSSHNVKTGPGAPLSKIPTFSCLPSWHLWNSLAFSAWGIYALLLSSLHCTFPR